MSTEEIDKLQEFIESDLHSDVSKDVYNQIMSDAETLDMSDFNKKWDKFLRDHSTGWKDIRSDTKPLKERVSETFKDDLNPSDNWIYENFPADNTEAIKTILQQLREEELNKKAVQNVTNAAKEAEELRFARQKAVDGYKHPYFGGTGDEWYNVVPNKLADFIISDATKRQIIEDPNADGKIAANAAIDMAGFVSDFTPGYGQLVGPTLRTARNAAIGKNAEDVVKEAIPDVAFGLFGAKGAKKFKTKGVQDDAIDVAENASNILNNKYSKAATVLDTEAKKAEDFGKGMKAVGDAIANIEDEAVFLADALKDPKTWAEWVESHADKPLEYEILKDIPYGDAESVLQNLKKKSDKWTDWYNNDYQRALTVKENNTGLYNVNRVINKSAPYAKLAGTGVAHHGTAAGTEKTPYTVSNPVNIKTDKIEQVKEWYKNQYARQWEAGFVPRKDDELKYQAWLEWKYNE